MKYLYSFVIAVLTLTLSFSVMHAQQGGSGGGAGSGVQDQDRDREQIQDPSTHTGTEPDQDREQDRDRLRDSDQMLIATSSQPAGNSNGYQNREQEQFMLRYAGSTTPAQTPAQLRQMVQERERELNQEANATTTEEQIVRNGNRVRLAVHTLLASEGLLGGIGAQVSAVAKEIALTAASTTALEAQIAERGFWRKLFFGGDRGRATTIESAVNQNRTRIEQITRLLVGQELDDEIRVQLEEQLRNMEQEQERLMDLAAAEKSRWGILSWRF